MEVKKNGLQLKIARDWPAQANQMKMKFRLLTDADLKFETGKEKDLVERLVIKLNKRRPEVVDLLMKSQSLKTWIVGI